MALSPILSPIFQRLAGQVGGGQIVATASPAAAGPSQPGDNGTPPGDQGLPPGSSSGGSSSGAPTAGPDGGSGPPPGDAAELFTEVTDLIDKGDDLGISEGELDDIQDLFEDMSTEELAWVLANMSDEQLERLFHNVHSSGFWSNDWNDRERREFYDNLVRVGQEGDADLWIRLGEFSPRLNPDPREGLPDSARDDETREEYYDGLTWAPITDPAFPEGVDPDFTDPRQGAVGDCYLIAGLISLAHEDPDIIRSMLTPNDNGTYTITFGDGHQEVVSATQVVDETGRPAFARGVNGGSWPTLIEKAYAQRYGGWGSDPGISGGQVSTAIERLTGRDATWISGDDVTIENLATRFENGDNLGISTIDRPDDMSDTDWFNDPDTPQIFNDTDADGNPVPTYDRLYQNHAFVIVDVDSDAGTVSVLNPWDPSQPPLEVEFEVLSDSINGIYANDGIGGD